MTELLLLLVAAHLPLSHGVPPLLDMCGSRRIHDPISTSVNHAVVAELLYGARRERGFYGGLYGSSPRARRRDLRHDPSHR